MGQETSTEEARERYLAERPRYSFWSESSRTQNSYDLKRIPPPPYGRPPPSYSPAPVNPDIENLGPKAATEVSALQREAADEEVFIMGQDPCQMQCFHCGHYVVSVVKYHSGFRTHLCSCLMCCSVFLIPLFWMPYIQNTCKDVHHYCPVCGLLLGYVGF